MSQDHNLAADQFYGKGEESLFPEGSFDVRPVPWPSASKERHRESYDKSVVSRALHEPPKLSEVDPRDLHATQRNITKQGVDYYLGDEYRQSGHTYADPGKESNRFPIVYRRPPGVNGHPENLLLSGHHRAAADLVKGQPLRAIVVEGGWGPSRNNQ